VTPVQLVALTIRRRALFTRRDRVAVAVSGGGDSVALTLILADLQARSGATVCGLIHVNHQLRGAASDGDEAFCRALAARLDLPIEVARVDVAAEARRRRSSIEVAARAVRYAFFADAAARHGATIVATGHTLDDQAETVLLRLLRGAGTRGISGIRPRRGAIVRPLIDTPRAMLRAFLESRGESWREDATNEDVSIARNRLRHTVLPAVTSFAPAAVRALARVADVAAADESLLETLAIEKEPALVLSTGESRIALDVAKLAAAPPALSMRVIRRSVERVGAKPLGARHLDAIRRLVVSERSRGSLDLPGLRADKQDAILALSARSGSSGTLASHPGPFRLPLPVPGAVDIPEAGLTITARRQTGGAVAQAVGTDPANVAVLDARVVAPPLVVRSRQPGDRLRPAGAPGHRKLQDVLVDRKIPRDRRDLVPIVEDADGRVVWVAGVTVAHEARALAPADDVVILELRKDQ
jgi:tRNA(Ile)-lysidine synthase